MLFPSARTEVPPSPHVHQDTVSDYPSECIQDEAQILEQPDGSAGMWPLQACLYGQSSLPRAPNDSQGKVCSEP